MSGHSEARNTRNNSNAAAGRFLAGAVSLTAGLAGIAVVGAVKGIAAVTRAGVSAYRSHKAAQAADRQALQNMTRHHQDVLEHYSREIAVLRSAEPTAAPPSPEVMRAVAGIEQQTAELRRHIDSVLDNQTKQFEAMHRSVQDAISGFSAEKLAQDIRRQREEAEQKWEAEERLLQAEVARTSEACRNFRHGLEEKFRVLAADAEAARSDRNKYRMKMKALAETAIHDADEMVSRLAKEPGGAVFAGDTVRDYITACKEAAGNYAAGSYELAYSRACDILLQAQECLADVSAQSARAYMDVQKLSLRAAMLSEALDGMKELAFCYDGKSYIVDLSAYEPDGFAAAEKQLASIFAVLDADYPLTEAEREQVAVRIRELEVSAARVSGAAQDKVRAGFQSLSFSTDIVRALATQGYRVVGSAFDEQERLHVNLRNPNSGSEVTAVISRSSMELFNYGAPGSQADPAQQKALCNAIRTHAGVEVRCSGLGTNATEDAPRNIEKIRRERSRPQPVVKIKR